MKKSTKYLIAISIIAILTATGCIGVYTVSTNYNNKIDNHYIDIESKYYNGDKYFDYSQLKEFLVKDYTEFVDGNEVTSRIMGEDSFIDVSREDIINHKDKIYIKAYVAKYLVTDGYSIIHSIGNGEGYSLYSKTKEEMNSISYKQSLIMVLLICVTLVIDFLIITFNIK